MDGVLEGCNNLPGNGSGERLLETSQFAYSCPTGVPPDGGTLARPRKLGLASTLKRA